MTYLDFLEQKVLLERLVIGLEEPILVKGLGELQAKIDSGNGGYNVIHGTDLHQQGSVLTFTSIDKFGHETKMSANIIDEIEVNMGGGNIEKRPVIELDIKFAGEDYKKIPFSVSDRSTNTQPILISKGFVENELEALIDVGVTNISNDGIDVVYGEGFAQGVKNVASGVKNFVKGGMNAAKKTAGVITNTHDKIGSAISNSVNWLKGGDDKDVLKPLNRVSAFAAGAIAGAIGSITTVVAKSLAKGKELEKSDKEKIRKQLPNLNFISKYAQNEEVSTEGTLAQEWRQTNFSKHPMISVAAFSCNKGGIASKNIVKGMEERVENWKSEIKDEKEKIKNYRQEKDASTEENKTEKNNSKEEDEETILNEAYMILEDDNQQQQQQEKGDAQENQLVTNFKEMNNFCLYYVPLTKNTSESESEILNNIKSGKFDSHLIKLYNTKGEKNSFAPIIKGLSQEFSKMNSKGNFSGFFVLCTGEIDRRQIDYFNNEVVLPKNSQRNKDKENEEELKTKAEKLLGNELKNEIVKCQNASANNLLSYAKRKYPDIVKTLADEIPAITHIANNQDYSDKIKEELEQHKGTIMNKIINHLVQQSGVKELQKLNINDVKSWEDLVKATLPLVKETSEEEKDEIAQDGINDANYDIETNVENEEEPFDEDDKWVREKIELMKKNGIL